MAAERLDMRSKPVAIAPAIPGASGATGYSPRPMPYTCQSCAKRKVKCDRLAPRCSKCRKSKVDCLYQAPRPRKRKLSSDVNNRPSREDPIQSERHASSQPSSQTSLTPRETSNRPNSLEWDGPKSPKSGRLMVGGGKSRYIDSTLWRNLGDDEMQPMSDDDDEEDHPALGMPQDYILDPLTGAFMGCRQSLLQYHPAHANAMRMWRIHTERVEPLCKILHIPSTSKTIEFVSSEPAHATKTDECLLFAVYHFAIFSLTEEECIQQFNQPRAALLQNYHFATRQALVNASFLKTTEMTVLQALVLFLLSCRSFYDPQTYWILTGVAVRIAQRMGIHRDGEELGMPPFCVQMRRRLFYQLLPLDGIAGQMSGAGIGAIPDNWDTRQALNVNDDQMWQDMTEPPEEQKGATDMLFCLARTYLGKFLSGMGKSMQGPCLFQYTNPGDAEQVILTAESVVEERFIRYCDVVEPLHFLTIAMARCGINAMRIRIRLPKLRNQTATDAERRELFQLSQKIIKTDASVYDHATLRKRYQWHVKSFFLWGTWDALIVVLTSLGRLGLLQATEVYDAWRNIEQVFDNHAELLHTKRELYVAFGRLTLKAWATNPPTRYESEPAFIATLRSRQKDKNKGRNGLQESNAPLLDVTSGQVSWGDPLSVTAPDALLDSLLASAVLDGSNNFTFNVEDWIIWDQLVQNDQVQGEVS